MFAWLKTLLTRTRTELAPSQTEREFDDELNGHLEMLTEENLRRGMTIEEARRAARIRLGGMTQLKEANRELQGLPFLETLLQDLRFAFRMLRKNPGFTAVAVLTLALGIGANTAIFSAVNTLLLQPLPVNEIDGIMFSVALREGFDPFGSSLLEYQAFRERSHVFSSMGISTQQSFNLNEGGEPERIEGATVDAGYLQTLGVTAAVGRDFTPEEYRPGGPAVALVGYGLWKRRFGGDANVVGRTLRLDARSTTIVGILPPGFDLPNAAEIWMPDQSAYEGMPLADRLAHSHELVGRLKPGVSRRQADGELKSIEKELEREYPRERAGWTQVLISLRQEVLGDLSGRVEKALLTLTAAVGFLLLICCGNVASLLLARGVTRGREMALRRTLGADWFRLVRQLATESTVLALIGGAVGLALAYAAVPLLRWMNPIVTFGFVGPLTNIQIDLRVLAFVGLTTVLTALICALMPVLKTAGTREVMPMIRDGGQRGSAGTAGRKWLSALVIAELAIAVPLLAGGALLIESFRKLQHVELGFRPENLLTMRVVPSPTKYGEFEKRVNFVKSIVGRVRQVPGVESAGITTNMPLTTFISYDSVFAVEGHPPVNTGDVPITAHRLVTPEYLRTLGVTLVRGRLLDEHDRAGSLPVAVISEELARQGWTGEEAVGKRIRRIRPGQPDLPWMTVVGVVKDVKEDRFNFRINRPVWYLPYEQNENTIPLDLVVKTNGDPASFAAAVRDAVHEVDADQPVSNVSTMNTHLGSVVVTERFSAVLMGALAGLGLTLAIVGLYGVMAYTVSRETNEMGLRAALGATPRQILGMVVGRATRMILAGLALGVIAALALTRYLSGALYGVSANDPLIFGLVGMVLALVAVAACYLPARRAMQVDPIVALRYE